MPIAPIVETKPVIDDPQITNAVPAFTGMTNNRIPVTDHKINITSATELSVALSDAKELLLLSALNNNIEISEFTSGHIKFFNRNNDKDFVTKLGKWLHDKTGQNWNIEQIAESVGTSTAKEQSVNDAKKDPMVANALDLFAGAEIININ